MAADSIHEFKMKNIEGKEVELSEYKGKVLLVVNVASKCGATPQYEQLQALQDKYKEKGLVVVGVPCNQFGGQEPGSEAAIKTFCETRFGVTFPMFEKVEVNGPGRDPLYAFLTQQPTQPDGPGDIGWNFAKFLIDRQGQVAHRFAPPTAPASEEIVTALEALM